VHALWTPSVRGKCLDATVLGAVSAIITIFTDVAIFVLPLRSIWRMRLPARQRVQVIAVLATGLVYASYVSTGFLCSRLTLHWQCLRCQRRPSYHLHRADEAIRCHLVHTSAHGLDVRYPPFSHPL
jgi:hypothetical protein